MTRLPRRQAASLPLPFESAGEGRNERRRHRALGKEVTDEVGDSECDVERVHVRRGRGAEHPCQHNLPGDPEEPARHRRDADQARGPGQT